MPEKRGRKEDTGGGHELAAENTREVRLGGLVVSSVPCVPRVESHSIRHVGTLGNGKVLHS